MDGSFVALLVGPFRMTYQLGGGLEVGMPPSDWSLYLIDAAADILLHVLLPPSAYPSVRVLFFFFSLFFFFY